MRRIVESAADARKYATLWDLKFAASCQQTKLFGWVLSEAGDRLIECYPGGRAIDWTKTWRRIVGAATGEE